MIQVELKNVKKNIIVEKSHLFNLTMKVVRIMLLVILIKYVYLKDRDAQKSFCVHMLRVTKCLIPIVLCILLHSRNELLIHV